jgi:hypothetical protein
MPLISKILLLFVAVNMSKLHIDKSSMQEHEMAMSKGMTISIISKIGNLRIDALDDLTRKLYWDGKTRQAIMRYRDERWFGNFGAYSPGGRNDVHIVITDGQQHFCSQQEALEWLMFPDYTKTSIYTSDGLSIMWHKENNAHKGGRDLLSVDITQIYILGKKAANLPNAQDSLFAITYSKDYADIIQIGKFQPSMPEVIGQRLYSGKAIDIMKEQGISAEQVEHCIAKGISSDKYKHDDLYERSEHCANMKKGSYISYTYTIIDKDGRVVLVGS